MTNKHLRRLITTAVFLAISLILRMTVAGYIPLFGVASGIRVGVHGVFTIMPAILFGPWYGAMASGLGDWLGFLLRPEGGAWLWQMTIIMTVGGFVRGWAWRVLRGRSQVGTRSVVAAATVLLLAFGGFSMLQLHQDGINSQFYENVENPSAVDTSQMGYISRLLISRTQNTARPYYFLPRRMAEVVHAPLGAGAFGIALLGLDFYLTKKMAKGEGRKLRIVGANSTPQIQQAPWYSGLVSKLQAPWNGSIMPLALTIIIVSLLINTANSVLLWAVAMPGWRAFPFTYIWLPRAVAALLISIVNVFIAVFLMKVCERLPHLKALTK